MKNESSIVANEKFVPKGAMAFFGLVLLIMAGIWLGVYLLMLKQA